MDSLLETFRLTLRSRVVCCADVKDTIQLENAVCSHIMLALRVKRCSKTNFAERDYDRAVTMKLTEYF